jgi:hypothetical protein
MKTRPFTDAHAIAEFEMALFTDGELTEETAAALLAKAESIALDLLPNASRFQDLSEDQPRAMGAPELGVRLYGTDPADGRLTMFLDFYSSIVRFVMRDYRGWTHSKASGLRVLFEVKRILAELGTEIVSCGLSCDDRFVLEDLDAYDFHDVFQPFPRYLPPHLASVGPRWHSWNGWIDDIGDETEILHNFNVAAASSDETHVTSLVHRMQLVRQTQESQVLAESDIDRHLESMHELNKKLIRGCLSKQMGKQVGLLED